MHVPCASNPSVERTHNGGTRLRCYLDAIKFIPLSTNRDWHLTFGGLPASRQAKSGNATPGRLRRQGPEPQFNTLHSVLTGWRGQIRLKV